MSRNRLNYQTQSQSHQQQQQQPPYTSPVLRQQHVVPEVNYDYTYADDYAYGGDGGGGQRSSAPGDEYSTSPQTVGGWSSGGNAAGGSSSAGVGSLRTNGAAGRSHIPPVPPSNTSPQRPARSQRRSQIPGGVMGGSGGPPPIVDMAPAQLRVDPSMLHDGVISIDSPADMTPISPDTMGGGGGDDPWATERALRSQARQASHGVAQAAAAAHRGGSTQNSLLAGRAIDAFKAGLKHRDNEPPRRIARRKQINAQSTKDTWDDLAFNTGGKFAEIDGVMRAIRKDWPFIMEGDFSPSSLALSLLAPQQSDTFPDHPDLNAFMSIHGALSTSLQKSVQSHFQTFAASLPTHTNFVAALERAQAQVKSSREALKEAREGISGKGKAELASVRMRERMVREMLQVLDLIDELKQVPEQLESCIAEKRFLQAALLLVRSSKTSNREDVRDIGAVSDLRQYFQSQEGTLTDILVDELHNQIYLKSFSTQVRWRAWVPGQHTLPVMDDIDKAITKVTAHQAAAAARDAPVDTSRFSRYISSLAIKPNHEPILTELSQRAPGRGSSAGQKNTSSVASFASITSLAATDNGSGTVDSFSYMETLLEALAALGRLGQALDVLVQRVPTEIHTLIETTMEEVEERVEERAEDWNLGNGTGPARPPSMLLAERQDLERMPLFDNDTLRVVMSLNGSGAPKHAVTLRDLLWTLYSKLGAVMEGHRAVYEVARWIASRRDFKDMTKTDSTLNVPVLEIWRPVQQEVRSLLQIYLRDEAQGLSSIHNSIPSVNEVLREGRLVRDKQRELFKFNDSDTRAVNNEIKEIDEALKQTLRASVPGLINLQAGESINVISGPTGTATDERYSSMSKYRTLIPANPFNVTVLFEPTIAFIERATTIVPPGFEEDMSQFGSVLEEFVANVFLPTLDEKVTASFQHAVSGYDAFQVDQRPSLQLDRPPLKSSVRVMALIQSLCAMLEETPFHRENYSRLIVGVVVQYYQQLSTRFKDLVTFPTPASAPEGTAPETALPAQWAQREDLQPILNEVRDLAPKDHRQTEQVGQKEVRVEMELLNGKSPREAQLINSNRKLESLGNLANSIRWFMTALLDLQQLADDDTLDNPQAKMSDPGDTPRLPLTKAMSKRFEAIVQTYEQLIDMTLNALHLEVRCRVLCNLNGSLQRTDMRLESETLEPDPDVTDLNTTLMEMDSIASKTLCAEDHDFMFRGLAQLIDHVMVHASRRIKAINAEGAHKLRRNVLSLQQTLRGILQSDTEGMLTRSAQYWDMFDRGPKAMLEGVRTSKPLFSFEDYNALLTLMCKKDPEDNASPELNTYLIDLHALSMSVEGWEMEA